jgi:hypothetical protein
MADGEYGNSGQMPSKPPRPLSLMTRRRHVDNQDAARSSFKATRYFVHGGLCSAWHPADFSIQAKLLRRKLI